VYCDGADALVEDCILTGNHAYYAGGGEHYGTVNNCLIEDNSATWFAGGSSSGTLNNCTLSDNSATRGGGSWYGTLNNCIVYYNTAFFTDPNFSAGTLNYCCSDPLPPGESNITNAPRFVATNAGNYRLQAGSPCINAGTNQAWMTGAADLDGKSAHRGQHRGHGRLRIHRRRGEPDHRVSGSGFAVYYQYGGSKCDSEFGLPVTFEAASGPGMLDGTNLTFRGMGEVVVVGRKPAMPIGTWRRA